MIHFALWLASLLFLCAFGLFVALPVAIAAGRGLRSWFRRLDDALCLGAAYVICAPVLLARRIRRHF